jgi:hypothetical protein
VNELRVSLVCQTCVRCCSVSLCVSVRVSVANFYTGCARCDGISSNMVSPEVAAASDCYGRHIILLTSPWIFKTPVCCERPKSVVLFPFLHPPFSPPLSTSHTSGWYVTCHHPGASRPNDSNFRFERGARPLRHPYMSPTDVTMSPASTSRSIYSGIFSPWPASPGGGETRGGRERTTSSATTLCKGTSSPGLCGLLSLPSGTTC